MHAKEIHSAKMVLCTLNNSVCWRPLFYSLRHSLFCLCILFYKFVYTARYINALTLNDHVVLSDAASVSIFGYRCIGNMFTSDPFSSIFERTHVINSISVYPSSIHYKVSHQCFHSSCLFVKVRRKCYDISIFCKPHILSINVSNSVNTINVLV